MAQNDYERNVFINCPFDSEYLPLLHALVYAIYECGFNVRTALEIQNFNENRLQKILRIIGESKFGIHDLSRVEIDRESRLPRFNMPLELGLFLGAHHFGGTNHKAKVCLVADSDRYRYQKFLSDVAGQDPVAHRNSPEELIRLTRNWLRPHTDDFLPGETLIVKRFERFQTILPKMLKAVGLRMKNLTLFDYAEMVRLWITKHPIA